jgi:hypothetical protein
VLVAAIVVAGTLALVLWQGPENHVTDEQLRAVCAQCAGLDLSGLAPLCRAAGYQQ